MNAETTNERGKDMLTECKLIIMCLDLKLLSQSWENHDRTNDSSDKITHEKRYKALCMQEQ